MKSTTHKDVTVHLVGKLKDGGSIHYRTAEGEDIFVDNRIQTTTPGCIFNGYPGKEGVEELFINLIVK